MASGDSGQKDLLALVTFAHGAIFSCFGSKWGRRQVYVLAQPPRFFFLLIAACQGNGREETLVNRNPSFQIVTKVFPISFPEIRILANRKLRFFSALTKLLANSTYIKYVPLDMK